jgi:hypothetical protein
MCGEPPAAIMPQKVLIKSAPNGQEERHEIARARLS